jgi:hypothetical protein
MEVGEGYDQDTMEDVRVSQGPPFMGSSETVGHTHTHGDSRARGSYSVFHGIEFRVERLLGELNEALWPLIILLIKRIWVSCVVSTWRGHIFRGAYFVSHMWIWDLNIICRFI